MMTTKGLSNPVHNEHQSLTKRAGEQKTCRGGFFFFVVLNGLRGKREKEKEKRTHQTKKGSNLRSKSQLEGKFVVEPVSGSVWSVWELLITIQEIRWGFIKTSLVWSLMYRVVIWLVDPEVCVEHQGQIASLFYNCLSSRWKPIGESGKLLAPLWCPTKTSVKLYLQ